MYLAVALWRRSVLRSRAESALLAGCLLVLSVAPCFAQDESPTTTDGSSRRESITILRDEFGTPHIFADSTEGAAYGMGYAQAEDRLDQLLRQYRLSAGTMAEAFGPEFVRHDYRQRLWRHAEISQARYGELSPAARGRIEAYLAGVQRYMDEHPDEVPEWAPKLEGWSVVALGRFILWGWPEGEAAEDLQRAGVEPDKVEPRGSNQWVIAARRTTLGAPVALIDPHLSFYGPFRFYEARMYGGDLAVSGMAIVGLPMISLGHNRHLSFAKTTGGPDTADVYEEQIHPENPRQYRYDDAWREMTVRSETIRVKDGDEVQDLVFDIEDTHHGPVVARRDGKAYAMKLAYADEIAFEEQNFAMITAKNLAEFKAALAPLQLMQQNVMAATVDGDIFYVRNGRVPIRAPGTDTSVPLAGNTSATEWQGIHPFEDLLQIENPPQGYMQNCNVSPEFLMRDCPLVPEKHQERFYLFNHDNPLHQRAAMTLAQLAADDSVTLEDAKAIAMSTEVYGADVWQGRLRHAWAAAYPEEQANQDAQRLFELIVGWDRRCDANSTGAIAYYYWKKTLGDEVLAADRRGAPAPANVDDRRLIAALNTGAIDLMKDFGRLDVPYGDVYRIGRLPTDGLGNPHGEPVRTWPVGGGSTPGLATPRAIGFRPSGDGKTFVAQGGQTSPQLVVLSDPPKSYTLIPLGESDRADSPHYDDQAEKLFSPGRFKSTYFLDRDELEKHATKTTTLEWTRPAESATSGDAPPVDVEAASTPDAGSK